MATAPPGAAVAVSVTVGPAWLLVTAVAVLAMLVAGVLWRRRPSDPADEPDSGGPATGRWGIYNMFDQPR